MQEVKKHAGNNVVKLLVGNKCDLESSRAVSKEEGEKFAQSLGISFFEASAKNNVNINLIFQTLAEQIYQSLPESEKPSLKINNFGKKQSKDKCC